MAILCDALSGLAAGSALSPAAARDLLRDGFVVVSGPVPDTGLTRLSDAYDRAILEAAPKDLSTGRTGKTTRLHDFVNRGAEFDGLYVYPPLLEACCRVIGQPFKLSTMLARTLHPRAREQDLHVDFARDGRGWPMLGFIFMIDEFRRDNGATCFVPGSHHAAKAPADRARACGPAASMIIFNGSVLHGHGANETARPRRSIQGAYIRRDARSGFDLASRMRPETLSRVSALARCLLAV
jgi:hypothetical protein